MKIVNIAISILLAPGFSWAFQQNTGRQQPSTPGMADMHHAHGAAVPVSYAELKDTVNMLDRARQATAKYQDVRVAEAEGYQATGPEVPGMGKHFVRSRQTAGAGPSSDPMGFDAEQPPILLYEANPSAAGGYSLVGVSYLLDSAEGADGQPLNPPIPKSLAVWHRHENICVLPDRSTPNGLTEGQCRERGGRFIAQTQWMIHAWIWKESPLGVFSGTNPDVH